MTTTNWNKATETLDSAQTLLLVTHVNPDGDAIGSLLGLANALRERGKQPMTVVDGGVPPFLRFLPGADTVLPQVTEGEWDVMVSLDASDEERTGKAGAYGRAHSKTVVNVDHHPTNTMFGQVHVFLPDAVSTTEIVYKWLVAMNQPITLPVAVPLLTGLVTDTNGFRTSNVKALTLEIAQRLMEAGASLTEVTARTLGSTPYQTIQLWKQVLPSVELDGGVIHATIRRQDFPNVEAGDASSGGLVSFLLTANEAMVSVIFKEVDDGRVELSFRCKPGFDVATLAFSLGGGGHKQASGATIAGPLEQAKMRVLPLLRQVVAQGNLTIV
jgi:phosphoesterase RecJ-like protein